MHERSVCSSVVYGASIATFDPVPDSVAADVGCVVLATERPGFGWCAAAGGYLSGGVTVVWPVVGYMDVAVGSASSVLHFEDLSLSCDMFSKVALSSVEYDEAVVLVKACGGTEWSFVDVESAAAFGVAYSPPGCHGL